MAECPNCHAKGWGLIRGVCNKCGKTFCQNCSTGWLSGKCPHCGSKSWKKL